MVVFLYNLYTFLLDTTFRVIFLYNLHFCLDTTLLGSTFKQFYVQNQLTINHLIKKLQYITKTCLYKDDPLKRHFYIVKLGFTGVYIIFLISAKNIYCGYSLELPHLAILTSTHNLCFEQKYETYQRFFMKIFIFWWQNVQYI